MKPIKSERKFLFFLCEYIFFSPNNINFIKIYLFFLEKVVIIIKTHILTHSHKWHVYLRFTMEATVIAAKS